jgi:acyl carrier protein
MGTPFAAGTSALGVSPAGLPRKDSTLIYVVANERRWREAIFPQRQRPQRTELIMRRHTDRAEVDAFVRKLLREVAQIPDEFINDEATIDENLRMQSVTLVEIQVAVEDEYDIAVDIIEVVERNQLRLIVDYIHGLIAEKS